MFAAASEGHPAQVPLQLGDVAHLEAARIIDRELCLKREVVHVAEHPPVGRLGQHHRTRIEWAETVLCEPLGFELSRIEGDDVSAKRPQLTDMHVRGKRAEHRPGVRDEETSRPLTHTMLAYQSSAPGGTLAAEGERRRRSILAVQRSTISGGLLAPHRADPIDPAIERSYHADAGALRTGDEIGIREIQAVDLV